MRGRNLKKLMSIIISTGMLVMLLTGVVSAGTTYTPVNGDNTTCVFYKYLIVGAGDQIPNATFSFSIAPGTAISTDTSDNSVMEVLAGVGSPSIADVTFTSSDTTYTSVQTNDVDVARTAAQRVNGATSGVQFDTSKNEKYAKNSTIVDFSSVSFPEPGIYRYIISEDTDADHAAAGITHDTDVDRVLDVYVIDNEATTDNDTDLLVAAYVLHTEEGNVTINTTSMGSNDVQTAGAALADKTDGFTNEYSSKDLKIMKEVTGNQASRDKYFELTVTCPEIDENGVYQVSIGNDNDNNTSDGNADATSGTTTATISANQSKANFTTATSDSTVGTISGSELKDGRKFYLQHGQSIVIRGLAADTKYYVTENAEDYASAVMSGKTNGTAASPAVVGTVAETMDTANHKLAEAGFTNTRNGVIPTGILLSATGLIVVALIVVFGIVFFAIRSKKRYEEE